MSDENKSLFEDDLEDGQAVIESVIRHPSYNQVALRNFKMSQEDLIQEINKMHSAGKSQEEIRAFFSDAVSHKKYEGQRTVKSPLAIPMPSPQEIADHYASLAASESDPMALALMALVGRIQPPPVIQAPVEITLKVRLYRFAYKILKKPVNALIAFLESWKST